jgi:hypothetical protein
LNNREERERERKKVVVKGERGRNETGMRGDVHDCITGFGT